MEATASYLVVQVSAAGEEQAWAIARAVVERRLAACAQVLPMRSCYTGRAEVTENNEYLVFIRSRAEAYDAIEACVKDLHSYEVPSIIAMPIVAGSAPYLRWIDDNISVKRKIARRDRFTFYVLRRAIQCDAFIRPAVVDRWYRGGGVSISARALPR